MDTNEVGAMREQFARFLDYVNEQANSAGLVSGLQAQVNDLTERVRNLEQQNYNLQQALNDANSRREQVERDLAVKNDDYQRAITVNDGLRNTIVDADHRVNDLNTQLANEVDGHRITKANLEDSRRATQEWEQRANTLSDDLRLMTASSDEWHNRANDWEKRASELQAKLDRVTSILSPAIVTSVQTA